MILAKDAHSAARPGRIGRAHVSDAFRRAEVARRASGTQVPGLRVPGGDVDAVTAEGAAEDPESTDRAAPAPRAINCL